MTTTRSKHAGKHKEQLLIILFILSKSPDSNFAPCSDARKIKYGVDSLVSKWYYIHMPRKIRELLRELSNAGFLNRGGKGSHRNLRHPSGVHITISGHDGNDAKPYQEKSIVKALKETHP